ncbi:MAG: hypothetical protein IKN72_03860 [Clostridia bacterium]|nr:hypothetical protein [Clostridia bacterium]
MAKAKQLSIGKMEFRKADGSLVPWDSLTSQEIADIHAVWSRKLSETMSAYYTRHPQEYARLQCGTVVEDEEKSSAPGGHPNAEKNTTTCKTGQAQYITA